MSLTKIGSIGINTGIAFAGVTTIVTLNTANDALSIGATVNVGSGITLGASGDIFATGVSTFSGNLKVGSGVTISPDGDGFYTGVVTATTFSGALAASSLTGALPAISGANLTNLDASDLASGTVPTARLGSGTASSSTFLRGDSTFQTVNTDLVSDTSPQLGGDLASNGNNIDVADSTGVGNNRIKFGTSGDLQIYHDSNDSYIHDAGTGHLNILATNFRVRNADSDEIYIVANDDGAVELYHDNSLRFETTSSGTRTTGAVHVNDGSASGNRISIGNGGDIKIFHTNPNSYIQDGSSALVISSARLDLTSPSGENMARFYQDAQVELYHNNVKKLQTNDTYGTIISNTTDNAAYTNTLLLTRRGYETSGHGVIFQAKGGSISAQNGLNIRLGTGSGSYLDKFTFDNDGLKFGGDTAAANALDDYEEGSWTPTIVSGGWTISSNNYMKYVKVGGLVFVQFYFGLTGSGSNTALRIGGLPFSNPSGSYSAGIADIGNGGIKGAYHRVESNSSQFEYFYSSESVGQTRIALNGNQIGAAYLIGSFSYFTAS